MKKHSELYLIIFILLAVIIFMLSQNKKNEYTSHNIGKLGTDSTITIITASDGEKHLNEITQIIDEYHSILTPSEPEGELFRFNTEVNSMKFSADAYSLIKATGEFYEKTDGHFDVTVGSVMGYWLDLFAKGIFPKNEDINESIKAIGFNKLIFDDENHVIEKTNKNQNINLGAAAKGYITDKISEYLENQNINDALVNLGGNIYAKGKNKNNEIWNIGIADPDDAGNALLSLRLSDKFIITSGNYIRYADIDGVRYHHIIDAKTGYPVFNELKSVTIISDNGFIGDALSTSCFLLGMKKGIELAEEYNTYAIFVTKDNKIYYNSELEDKIEKISNSYEYIKY